MKQTWLKSAMLAGTALLVACEVGPDYNPPPVAAPIAYKEGANWSPANPEDAIDRGAWWSIYHDPVLDNLERQIDISNQNLKEAEAAWRAARAGVEETRAQLFPTVSADSSAIRAGGGSNVTKGRPITTYDLSAGASWVPDIWGKIRREVESSEATAQASAADLALARLTAQAELATDYYSLRGQDELKYLLDATTVADERALKIVENQYKAGVAAQADVLTARTQLESVQAQDINTGVLRTQFEHAIAVLIGKPPAELTIVPAPLAEKVPVVPAGVPSALLQRRPDIAAAEREMASANAEIGVAVAAYYPDLSLAASYGFTAPIIGQLIQAPNTLWSFGPSLAETVFDAGLRDAQVEAARATYDEQVAAYRQAVLTGFQQVEDELSALRVLQDQAKMETSVVNDAKKAEQLTMNQYRAGTVPYSSVLTAQVTTLSNEQTALTVRQNRFVASIALIEALGGGWDVSQLPVGDGEMPVNPAPNNSSDNKAATTVNIINGDNPDKRDASK
jgi:NodT family efflux transporter outer membrane factor (OMF) lipoprotein